jgi:hypothetical protein
MYHMQTDLAMERSAAFILNDARYLDGDAVPDVVYWDGDAVRCSCWLLVKDI